MASTDGSSPALANQHDTSLSWYGSCPAEDHEIHAIDVCLHFIQLFRRSCPLLDGPKPLVHCPDEAHQKRDCGIDPHSNRPTEDSTQREPGLGAILP